MLICRIFILIFCFIFIPIKWSLKSFGENFWQFLIVSCWKSYYRNIYFVSFIVKIILLRLPLVLSLAASDKKQYFIRLSFNLILQLINGISSDLQKLLKYFNGTAIVYFFRIPLALYGLGWASVFANNLALCLKDLKSSVFPVLLSKSVASSFQ